MVALFLKPLCLFYPFTYQKKMPFNALVFNLVKLPKKLNIDLCQFFFLIERKHCPYKNHEIKNGGHLTRFCDRAADFWERTGASFKESCMWKGEESLLKKLIRFYRIYIQIAHLGPCVIKKAFLNENQSKNKFNIHYRGSPWGSRTQQHARVLLPFCTFPTHSTLSLTSARSHREQKFQ